MEFYLDSKPWHQGIDVSIRVKEDGYYALADPLVMAEVKGHMQAQISQPCFTMENQAAQSLMDQLWGCGIRPSEGTGSAGSLAATERHLADMRSIAMTSVDREARRLSDWIDKKVLDSLE
jgi:hypothetical protein